MKMAFSSKWQILLLFIIVVSLLAGPSLGCKTPIPDIPITPPPPAPSIIQAPPPATNSSIHGLVPFINETWEYTVYFPQDWYVENNLFYDDRGILDFHAPKPYHGMISVEVYDIEKTETEADIELIAQQQIDRAKEMWGEITLVDNTGLIDNWDWHFTFDGVLWGLDFHVMTYLKQTDRLLYKLKLQFVEDEFDDAYLSKMKLVPEAFVFRSG